MARTLAVDDLDAGVRAGDARPNGDAAAAIGRAAFWRNLIQ